MDVPSTSKQSRLLGRLLGKLRGEHRCSTLDKSVSYTSTGTSESIGCGSTMDEEEFTSQPTPAVSNIDHAQFATKIDTRYGGQYLTPEQLPEFCNQLHLLVDVIRNIESYAKVTSEYPRELERRLEQEAAEVAALANEAKSAHQTAARLKLQRRALKIQRSQLMVHVEKLKEAEVQELEATVRSSNRKFFKKWEAMKENKDTAAFDAFLEEIRNRQTGLDCLYRLVKNRRAQVQRSLASQPLPLPSRAEDSNLFMASSGSKRNGGRCRSSKQKKAREPKSTPLSSEPNSHHQNVTLYITGGSNVTEASARPRAASVLPSLELPRGSIRDIMFFHAG